MFRYLLSLIFMASVSPVNAKEITLPAGTQIYLEPVELVTSKRGENNVGDIIRAEVWRNVTVGGYVVIKAGAPAIARVTELKRRNIAGKKGQMKLLAVSARGVDGQDIRLDGGYHEEGKSRVALSVTLFLLVAWPLIFIPGKNAEMGPGNIFDGDIREDTIVDVTDQRPVLRIATSNTQEFVAEVRYDDIDPEVKLKELPLELRQCERVIRSPQVVTINDERIDPIPLEILQTDKDEEDCTIAKGTLKFKKLVKQFQLGINRFEVESNGQRSEIIFQAEM